MNKIQNAALIMLSVETKSFHTSLPIQKKASGSPLLFSSINQNMPFTQQTSEKAPLIGEYISKEDGSIQQFPSIGKEFKQLSGEDFYKAMYMAYASNDYNFSQDAIPPKYINEVLVCSNEDYYESENSGNCYNFATGTQCGENEKYEQQFPKGTLPQLGFEKKEDNCDSIKNDLLLEPGMRIKEPDEECQPDEREIISYYSPTNQDVHFVVSTPSTARSSGSPKQYFHKAGGTPARQIDDKIIESGHIPETNAIYIIKDSNEEFDIFDQENYGRMRFSNEATPPYDECDRFCFKIQQERQSSTNRHIGR